MFVCFLLKKKANFCQVSFFFFTKTLNERQNESGDPFFNKIVIENAPTRVFFDDLEEPCRDYTRPQRPLSSVFVFFFFKKCAKSAVVVATTTTEEPKRRFHLGNRIFRAFLVILFLLVSIGATRTAPGVGRIANRCAIR